MSRNPMRCALAEAERRGDAVTVLVNVIDIDTKRAGGPPKVSRALMSGLNTNLRILEKKYQKKVREILNKKRREPIYETTTETLDNILSGLDKITNPGGVPVFSGKVLILLGHKEEAFIKSMAYWEWRYATMKKIHQLDGEIRAANREGFPADDLVEERARTIISFIRGEDWQKMYELARTFFIKKLKAAIPNSRVVGHKTTFLKFGDAVVEFFVPDDDKPSDTLLAEFADHYGPQVLRKEFPEAVVVCHPHSLNFRMTAREVDADGKRGSAQIFVAPIAVDGAFLRKATEQLPVSHKLYDTIFNSQFQPGVLRLECLSKKVINASEHSVRSLIANAEKAVAFKRAQPEKLRDFWRVPYIWVMSGSDPHWGWPSKEFVRDIDTARDLGVCEAVIEMMRRSGLCEGAKLPVHIFVMNDDPTQGNHFQIQQHPHPHKMPYVLIEKEWLEKLEAARKASPEDRLRILLELWDFTRYQFKVRGEMWTKDQMEQLISRHLKPNADFFDSLLQRAVASGLVIKGVSAFQENISYDARDIGAINYGTGNHFAKSVNGEMSEGVIYAEILRCMLQGRPAWNNQEGLELIERLVKAPLYSNQFIGWGTIQVPGGYEWGVEFRDTPTTLTSWGDTLLGAVRNDEKRANYPRIFEGKVTLKTCGDKHFATCVRTSHAFYHMAPPGNPTDLYGERGFPPNNTGVSFIGLPVYGPDSGPILARLLLFNQIRDYFANPYDFDWKAFLPNPA